MSFVQILLLRLFRILFLFIVTKSQAQEKVWQELTISDGLSQGMCHDITQDARGFVWIGTNDGLNRYDGHNFKVFTNDPYDEYSISGNVCTALFVDSKKRLWVGTQTDGLNLYNELTHRFYHIDLKAISKFKLSNVNYINEDPEGNLWVSNFQGEIFKITLPDSLKEGFPTLPTITYSVTIQLIGSFRPDSRTTLFAFDAQGLAYICDSENFYTVDWRNPSKITSIAPDLTTTPFFSLQKRNRKSFIWMTPAALNRALGRDKILSSIVQDYPTNEFQLRYTASGKLLIASLQHLWLLKTPAELFTQKPLSIDSELLSMLGNQALITTAFEDNTGTVWVGTNGFGLRKFTPRVKQFQWYLPHTSLNNLYQDKQARLYAFVDHRYQSVNKQNNTTGEIFAHQLSGKAETYELIQDRNNRFWLATTIFENNKEVNYLVRYSPEWKLEKKYLMPAEIVWSEPGVRIIEDKAGKLWLTAYNGKIICFDPTHESTKVVDFMHLAPNTPTLEEPTGMYQDHSGLFWVGTKAGLIKMEASRTVPQFSLFSNSTASRKTLSNNHVSGMIDDPYQPTKFLWVSTKGGGLERLDKQTGTFEHFTEKQGLPNKVVYGVLEDERKNLWMSTNRGLSQLNPKTLIFKNYTKEDGLQDDEFNTNSFYKAPTGELLFGGLNGLNIFRARDIQSTGRKPTVQIVGLKINNEEIEAGDETRVLSESIEHTPSITLAHDQNQLSLELAVMDFTNPAKNRYRYQLMGISKTWIEVGTNRIINFSQLSSGTYTLLVSGSVNGEFWSDPVTLKVQVKPPFYATWWAYLVYVALIFTLIWRWNQSRIQRLLLQQELVFKEKEANQMAELNEIKTRFFTNVSHEFRTPLTLILNLVADLGKKYPNDSLFISLKRNSQRLLSLINQLLDLSKLDGGQLSIHIQKGDLARFIQELTEGFGFVAKCRSIGFQFTQNRQKATACFDADFMEKILTNLLSNALKFTKKGGKIGLSIEYSVSLDSVKIIVKDDGIGISTQKAEHIFERFYQADGTQKRAYEGTGIGLALVKEIVALHRGTISVQSLEGIGTAFTVILPIDEQTWKNELAQANTATIHYRSIEPEALAALPLPANEAPSILVADDENILLLVEDNTELRRYIRSIFEHEYRIMEAVDGQDGLEKALQNIPDLVICDVMMPRMDGFEFCQRLKTDEKTNHIPVVMLTAKTNVLSKIQGHEMGADDYLTKPFYREELAVIVNKLILQRNTLRQKYEMKAVSLRPDEVKISSLEEQFMTKVKDIIESHITESSFGVEQFAGTMNVTPVVLRRKIKALTNQTVTEYVRNYRLQRAADLLRKRGGTVTEIAFQVGFENVSYFGKVFQDVYGKSPSEFSKTD